MFKNKDMEIEEINDGYLITIKTDNIKGIYYKDLEDKFYIKIKKQKPKRAKF